MTFIFTKKGVFLFSLFVSTHFGAEQCCTLSLEGWVGGVGFSEEENKHCVHQQLLKSVFMVWLNRGGRKNAQKCARSANHPPFSQFGRVV